MASSNGIPGSESAGPPPIILQEARDAAASAHYDDEPQTGSLGSDKKERRRHGGSLNEQEFPKIEDVPPPPYNATDYGRLDISQNGFDTGARVAEDGRVNIKINQRSRTLSNLLVPALRTQLDLQQKEPVEPYIPPGLADIGALPPPPMNIVIQIVGSRGDVQPFIALGQVLKNKYHHRVRIATHPNFRDFVTENGLEFFSIGGDPTELMAFMVKNPGLMPGFDSLKSGDVGKRRKSIYEIITGCWRSCIEAGDGSGLQASDDLVHGHASFDGSMSVSVDPLLKPFVADAIIANPPSFAHIHIAEKLGIPLHLMFTMPWSPTQAFPHPLANIQSSNADSLITNFVTYALVDMLTWQGLGDVINRFREKSLGLEPVSIMWAPGMASRLRIPYTYCWSPALIPKPQDWGNYIDISGFYFLDLASNYTPPQDLADFLAAGPPPVYIGFGSIVVDDPNAMTKLIFDAVKKTGQRALVSKGWGGFGADEIGIPEGVFMLGNCPHDWLFKRVSCVVHHGGAGTTAAGISAGRPTVVVPFFGDQPFWGAMTARAGAGPMPVPYKTLTADKLAAAIMEALRPESLARAAELSRKISKEKGAESGAESFHRQLHMTELRCSLCPKSTAVWRVKRTDIRLSALAATVLGNEGLLDFTDLKLYRPREYETEQGPWDPISGGAAALLGTIGNLTMGIADFPVEILKSLKTASNDIREPHKREKGSPTDSVPASRDASTVDLSQTVTPAQSRPTLNTDDVSLQPVTSSPTVYNLAPTESTSTIASDTTIPCPPPDMQTNNTHKASAMSSVLSQDGTPRRRWSRHGSRSGSPSGPRSQSPHPSDDISQLTIESAIGGAKAVGRIVSAGMKSPMDFTMSLAKGFHNAPKLYGDETVRKSDKVTGIQSGFKAAGKEFGYGFYDGITGLFTQPLAGAKKEGPAGFVKGAAKGIGGLILKPGAGIWGLPGYTFKGIYVELQKHFGSSVQNYIIAARTAQGYEEWKASTPELRMEIIGNWKSAQLEARKGGKKYGKEREEEKQAHLAHTRSGSTELFSAFNHTRHLSWDERKAQAEQKQKLKKEKKELERQQSLPRSGSAKDRERKTRCKFGSFLHDPHNHLRPTSSFPSLDHPPDYGRSPSRDRGRHLDDFEEAIQRSVTATSRGDPREDAIIERALRASVEELKKVQSADQSDEAYERAVAASIREAKLARTESEEAGGEKKRLALSTVPSAENDDVDEEDLDLKRALTRSLEEYHNSQQNTHAQHLDHRVHHDPNGREWSDSDSVLGTDDDEDLQRAVDESKRIHDENEAKRKADPEDVIANAAENDDELKKAIAESAKHAEDLARQRTEEEIVLEYVKKQSLLEEAAKAKKIEAESQSVGGS